MFPLMRRWLLRVQPGWWFRAMGTLPAPHHVPPLALSPQPPPRLQKQGKELGDEKSWPRVFPFRTLSIRTRKTRIPAGTLRGSLAVSVALWLCDHTTDQ